MSQPEQSAILPEGSYLASRYLDLRRGLDTRRVYFEDGSVRAFDGAGWWLVCRFSASQVQQAKQAIHDSGLLHSADRSDQDVRDPASLIYAWSLDGRRGAVANRAYPAREHVAFAALEARLAVLEDQAGAPVPQES